MGEMPSSEVNGVALFVGVAERACTDSVMQGHAWVINYKLPDSHKTITGTDQLAHKNCPGAVSPDWNPGRQGYHLSDTTSSETLWDRLGRSS
jgi:hypothetical protein